ncbi:MAG: carbohydrate ABC transporter substrate-binding protein [Ruminococcus sp.]|nr:carbohydrate ABC transporter substrate-binding protein [Ruminococcus sp.]
MKNIFLKAAAICCVFMLSACGNKKSEEVTPPDGKLDPCELRFSWWGGDDRHEATLNAIKLWEERHPEIKVIPEYGGWDGWTEKVTSQLSGGTEPDIMQINYDWLITMSSDGKGFYDLDKLSSELDLSGFSDDVISFGKVGGTLNAVTVSVTGRGLFYNSGVYNSIGADYPSTWDELFALGERFNEKDAYPLDLDIQSGGTAWYLAVVYVQQMTGRQFITMDGKLGFTVEDIKTALDFYKQTEDRHVIRTIRTRTDEDGNAALYQSPEFISGKIAGVLEWGSSVGKYESVLSDGALEAGPFITDGKGSSGGWMIKPSMLYAISRNTEHPDEAAAFIDFLLNDKECAKVLGTTRGIPASSYAEESLEESGQLSGLAQENDEMLEKLDTMTISPYMELSRMKEFYNAAIEKVSYGIADTDYAAQEMYDSITQYLEKIRK